MFISSKKCFEIHEGGQKLVIPCQFIGEIPEWAAGHWLVQAAIVVDPLLRRTAPQIWLWRPLIRKQEKRPKSMI